VICLKRLPPDIRDFMAKVQNAIQNALCNRLLIHIRVAADAQVDATKTRSSCPLALEMNVLGGTRNGALPGTPNLLV